MPNPSAMVAKTASEHLCGSSGVRQQELADAVEDAAPLNGYLTGRWPQQVVNLGNKARRKPGAQQVVARIAAGWRYGDPLWVVAGVRRAASNEPLYDERPAH